MTLIDRTNLVAAADALTKTWSPRVIGKVNDQLIKVAKLKGELCWHAHDDEDEMFYVIAGGFRMEFETHSVELREGDFLTVPKGVRHNPVAEEDCWVMLIEPASTLHTGSEVTEKTKSLADQMK
ncbi:MAG: cupin [Ponticaulis sp.]|nr:cupin [Ponticaulis sp.]|tara:strand:+ start:721 stop:1092 length:372 start_codon:yes stop_codon:yes gene_type:complete